MIRKRRFFTFLILFITISIFSFSLGLSCGQSQSEKKTKEPLSKWSKEWLEEVVAYIITNDEKSVFLNLPNEEERGKFIENFWKKRDPIPETPENEFKLEYYKRIALANKFFGFSGIEGWRTDRGKIYILLGPPNEIHRDLNPSSSSSTTFQGPNEIWDYWNLQSPKLPYNLEFVFVDKFGTGSYILERGSGLDQGASSPFDMNSLHFYFDYMENVAEAMRNPFENLDKLRGIVTTQVTYNIIPLEPNLFYLKGIEKRTHIPLVIKMPYSALTEKKIEDKYYFALTLNMNVKNNLGQVVLERSKDINFKYTLAELNSLKDKIFQVQTSFTLEPETYKLQLLVIDNFSGKIGTFEQSIQVPRFGSEELKLSDIILSRKGADEKEVGQTEEKRFSELSRVFRFDEELNLYLEVYNLALNRETGLNDLSVEYSFLQNGKLVVHVPSPKTNPTSEKDCRVQTSFRLKNLKPGEYTLQAKVIDGNSGKSQTKEVPFTVIQ